MKTYRIQDLASYGRRVVVDGQEVKFSGYYATVPEAIVYFFQRSDDFQVGSPTITPNEKAPEEKLADSLGYTPTSAESSIDSDTKGEPTTSPNLAEITKAEDTLPKEKLSEEPTTTGLKVNRRAEW